MNDIILNPVSYTIVSNSRLDGKLYSGVNSSTPSRIVGPFRKGTLGHENVPPNGMVSFSATRKGIVDFTYTPNVDFIGEDSFEFKLYFPDGSTTLQIVNIKVKEKITKSYVEERYMDVFLDDISQNKLIKVISSKYSGTVEIPTSVTYSLLNKDLSSSEKTSFHDAFNNNGSIINASTKTLVETSTSVRNITNQSNNTTIKSITSIEITITKDPFFYGNEYGVIKFKDFIDSHFGNTKSIEEHIYINWKLRVPDFDFEERDTYANIQDFDELPPPDFVYPDILFPEAPEQFEVSSPTEKKGGELFGGTKAHTELDGRGASTIKVGKKVPENAVNLAYYFNTTASIDDTVSVIETDMNNVTLHYAEEWIHKRDLKEMNDELFPKYIEFEGENGTELEGYWGILYREYVMWEEQTISDLDPQIKTVYQEYRGLTNQDVKNIPIIWNYRDDERNGKLQRTNTIIEPIDFYRGAYMPRLYTCYAKFEGLTTKNYVRYHGSGKYGGVVTKKDGMANIDPEQPREIIMFPDKSGLLSRENGDELVDDDLFFITDKFVDGKPLYYKHRLKYRIYDSIGPDKYGVYKSSNVKLMLENNYELNTDEYKWRLFIFPTKWKNIYDGYIYTSFVPTPEIPVYVMYDGMPEDSYIGNEKINPLTSKVGEIEKLSVYPAMHQDEYIVDRKKNITKQSTITMKEIDIIKDERVGVKIEYMIMAGDMESPVFSCEVMNHKYAISTEKDMFINEEMIVSSKSPSGYMTAKDMFLKYATPEQEEAITEDTIFRLRYNLKNYDMFTNKEKVVMYTDPSGGGLIMAKTYYDTGLPGDVDKDKGTPKMNRMVTDGHVYQVKDGNIYKGYSVMCRNVNQITVHPPIDGNPLKSWQPAINYAYFHKAYERIDKTIQLIYSVPEFYSQIYSEYGRPYVNVVGENPKNLGGGKVKVSRAPLYIEPSVGWHPKNIVGRKVLPNGHKRLLTVKDFDFKHGVIQFEDKLSDNDLIEVDYTYEEDYYHYRGYYEGNDPSTKMIDINLNPSMYSHYTDNKNELYYKTNVYNLFNRTIHFFLRPMRVIDKETGEILNDNDFCIYHRVDQPDAISPFDLHIGRIFIRHHTSLKSTKVIDTRSRGGGVLESIRDEVRRELEPESDYYLDIGTLDGKPYHENSVVVFKVDERLLIKNGGRFSEHEVKEAIQKWAAFGMYPIIEYVKVLHEDMMPQTTLEVVSEIENTIRFRPHINVVEVEE